MVDLLAIEDRLVPASAQDAQVRTKPDQVEGRSEALVPHQEQEANEIQQCKACRNWAGRPYDVVAPATPHPGGALRQGQLCDA
ncbi:hypothetical protein [Sphingomonas sp. Leaf62]|uniref:hypothetical protein n=1 Tax=Sphingomonas sp. Leaf62 TaxID=1736228 RepID=UPI001F43B421|nr:hypothetical protein [Sphingomonas sp. Leaf62]